MSTREKIHVRDLKLDLRNYRLPAQPDETTTISSLINYDHDYFVGLLKSIMGGYTAEGMIFVERRGTENIVREGNRRVAILKLALHLVPVPSTASKEIQQLIAHVPRSFKKTASTVECLVYGQAEESEILRVVARIHGYSDGDKNGRLPWEPVAKARYRRDAEKKPTPELDLFEKYLEHGENITESERKAWTTNYRLPMLKELLGGLVRRGVVKSQPALVGLYPTQFNQRHELESLMHRIGEGGLSFDIIRGVVPDPTSKASFDFAGLTAPSISTAKANATGAGGAKATSSTAASSTSTATPPPSKRRPNQTHPSWDPRSVGAMLSTLHITGPKREKINQLRHELCAIKLSDRSVLLYCLALRSLIEMTVRVWAQENGVKAYDTGGKEKFFSTLITEVKDAYAKKFASDVGSVKNLASAIGTFTDTKQALSWGWLSDVSHNHNAHPQTSEVATQVHKVRAILELLNA